MLKQIEVIKSSRSSTLNFQSCKNEANDLQSTNNEQATNYSPNLVNSSLKNLVTPYYFYSQVDSLMLSK